MSSLLSRTLEGVKEQSTKPARPNPAAGTRNSPYARPVGDDSWSHDMYNQHSAPTVNRNDPRQAREHEARPSGQRSAKLKISNVNYEISERELETLFIQIGPIVAGPKIKFDRSGRSLGVAWVTYGDEDLAEEAMKTFQGAPCKGDAIHIQYDFHLENGRTRGAAAPGTLLARIDDRQWGSRSSDRDSRDRFAPSGDRDRFASSGDRDRRSTRDLPSRSARGVGSDRPPRDGGAPRGGGGGGGARGGRGGGRGEKPARREPKTQDDLDRELEAFMKEPPKEPTGGAAVAVAAVEPAASAAPVAAEAPEVEMN